MEIQATTNMTNIMKKMHSPRNFQSSLKKFGSVSNYQNVSLARSIMFVKEKSIGTESHKHNLNMNSLMHNSSQFDKANMSTTINGTTISV